MLLIPEFAFKLIPSLGILLASLFYFAFFTSLPAYFAYPFAFIIASIAYLLMRPIMDFMTFIWSKRKEEK